MMQIGNRSRDRNVPAQQLRALVRWVAGCAVIAAMLAAGLAAAIAGGNIGRSEQIGAAAPAEHKAADMSLERSGNFISYDIVY